MDKISKAEFTRLQIKVIGRNLSTMNEEEQKRLVDGMKNVPVVKILEQAQYLENVLLPKIASNRGIESADYLFYKSVQDSLLWAIFVIDRYDYILTDRHKTQIQNEFLMEQLTSAKKELSKYHAAEDLLLSQSLDQYGKAISKRIQDKLNNNG